MTGAIFCETRPAMIIRSAWRGDGRKTSAPKRAMSKRDAPMAIISIAQQARPKVMGQMEFFRTQFTALSSVVSTTPSWSESPPNVARTTWRTSCGSPTVFGKRSVPLSGLLAGGTVVLAIGLILDAQGRGYYSASRVQHDFPELLAL